MKKSLAALISAFAAFLVGMVLASASAGGAIAQEKKADGTGGHAVRVTIRADNGLSLFDVFRPAGQDRTVSTWPGTVIHEQGRTYVVTSAQAAAQAGRRKDAITVAGADGKAHAARVVGADVLLDIAVLGFVGAQPGDSLFTAGPRSAEKEAGAMRPSDAGRPPSQAVSDIISTGKVQRPYLGIVLTQRKERPGGNKTAPLRLSQVDPEGPFLAMAKYAGSRLVSVNGKQVETISEALGELEKARPGTRVILGIEEAGLVTEITATGAPLSNELHARAANFFLREHAGLQVERCPEVTRIVRIGQCGECGIRTTFVDEGTGGLESGEGFPKRLVLSAIMVTQNDPGPRTSIWPAYDAGALDLAIRLGALEGRMTFIGTSPPQVLTAVEVIIGGSLQERFGALVY